MTAPYNRTDYDPPAPVFDVFVSAPGDPEWRVSTSALLDTGADVSVLAPGIAKRLGLPLLGWMELAGVNQQADSVPFWLAVIETPVGRFQLGVAEIGPQSIVGRDVLNQLCLTFDGPNFEVSS